MVQFGLALKSDSPPYHRCLVLSDTAHEDDYVVLVRLTTHHRNWPDEACILTPLDWPELTQDTTVAYSTAKVGRIKPALERAIQQGHFTVVPSPALTVLRRVCAIGRGYEFMPLLARQHLAHS